MTVPHCGLRNDLADRALHASTRRISGDLVLFLIPVRGGCASVNTTCIQHLPHVSVCVSTLVNVICWELSKNQVPLISFSVSRYGNVTLCQCSVWAGVRTNVNEYGPNELKMTQSKLLTGMGAKSWSKIIKKICERHVTNQQKQLHLLHQQLILLQISNTVGGKLTKKTIFLS